MKRFLAGVLVGVLISAAPVAAASTIRLIVNGQEVVSDVPPQMIGGRVMVPVRFVSEALAAEVSWDEASQTVTIRGGQLPVSVSCQLFDAIASLADQVQTLQEGLKTAALVAIQETNSVTQRKNLQDLINAGQAMADNAAQVESSTRSLIADYCPGK